MKNGLEKRWIEEKGWMREGMNKSSIHSFMCLVKHVSMDVNDSHNYLV